MLHTLERSGRYVIFSKFARRIKKSETGKAYHQLRTFQRQPSLHLTYLQNGQNQSLVYHPVVQVALQLLSLLPSAEIVPSDVLLTCSQVCSLYRVPLPEKEMM